jgi:hypothetical protein
MSTSLDRRSSRRLLVACLIAGGALVAFLYFRRPPLPQAEPSRTPTSGTAADARAERESSSLPETDGRPTATVAATPFADGAEEAGLRRVRILSTDSRPRPDAYLLPNPPRRRTFLPDEKSKLPADSVGFVRVAAEAVEGVGRWLAAGPGHIPTIVDGGAFAGGVTTVTLQPGVTVRATVRDADGAPVPDVRVALSPMPIDDPFLPIVPKGSVTGIGERWHVAEAVSGTDGLVVIEPVAPGASRLWVGGGPWIPLDRSVGNQIQVDSGIHFDLKVAYLMVAAARLKSESPRLAGIGSSSRKIPGLVDGSGVRITSPTIRSATARVRRLHRTDAVEFAALRGPPADGVVPTTRLRLLLQDGSLGEATLAFEPWSASITVQEFDVPASIAEPLWGRLSLRVLQPDGELASGALSIVSRDAVRFEFVRQAISSGGDAEVLAGKYSVPISKSMAARLARPVPIVEVPKGGTAEVVVQLTERMRQVRFESAVGDVGAVQLREVRMRFERDGEELAEPFDRQQWLRCGAWEFSSQIQDALLGTSRVEVVPDSATSGAQVIALGAGFP